MAIGLDFINHSIFEVIRLNLVGKELTPDVTTFPDTEAGLKQYLAALETIYQEKGFVFELFGTEAPFNRGQEKYPRIVLIHNNLIPGDVGIDSFPTVTGEEGSYKTQTSSNLTFDYYIDCLLLANSQKILQEGLNAIFESVPVMGSIPFAEIEDDSFFIKLDSSFHLDKSPEGTLGEHLTFIVPDVVMDGDRDIDSISDIKKIGLDLALSNYLGQIYRPAPLSDPFIYSE